MVERPPETEPERFADWNELMVARHDPESFHNHPRRVVRWIEANRVRWVLRALQARPEHRILELGCGAGNLLAQVAVGERHGLDLSKRMASRARTVTRGLVNLLCANAEQLPYRDNSFDRVVCSSVLTHVYDPERVLNEAFRVLKTGGRLVVSVSYEEGIERGLRLARTLRMDGLILGGGTNSSHEDVYSSEYHLHHFDLDLLRKVSASLPAPSLLRSLPTFLYPVHYLAVFDK